MVMQSKETQLHEFAVIICKEIIKKNHYRIISRRNSRKNKRMELPDCNKFQLREAEFIFVWKQKISIITIHAVIYQYYNYDISHSIFLLFSFLKFFFTEEFNFQVHLVQQSVVHIK